MTVRIDNYRSLYVAESLNGYVIVYKNTFKGITAPFNQGDVLGHVRQECRVSPPITCQCRGRPYENKGIYR